MSELNIQQKKILTFVTSFGVTYVLLDFNIKVLRATFNFLSAAFDNKDGEEKRQRRLEEKIRRRRRKKNTRRNEKNRRRRKSRWKDRLILF